MLICSEDKEPEEEDQIREDHKVGQTVTYDSEEINYVVNLNMKYATNLSWLIGEDKAMEMFHRVFHCGSERDTVYNSLK